MLQIQAQDQVLMHFERLLFSIRLSEKRFAVILIKCILFIDQQLWAPLYKQKFWQERHQHQGNCLSHQSGKVHEVISTQFGVHYSNVRKIIYKWKTFETVTYLLCGCPSIFTSRSVNNLRATFQTLQASVNVVNIKVHNITVRKTPKKYD